ncbi:1-acyl-sn-glycerol-3-phosphate acyltransferase [Candidatus Pantoea edessiphila]|uniref:1-acyl-sn-glycerol-3-phosphate acyltransferase n=1 Tax=Candidatus Pantoea edessiphila TaxID=2044610 RepID=A0A2P5T1S8_9GAMM|nr:1-acylglycerol-3-phosphate O-acyltransferase [Candidatus Pantoea edessiphila]PPI88516.1 1-acyl-sn-glycerol-3-phosphate acyltransferase [Candidatus Pantoea edessiphila]
MLLILRIIFVVIYSFLMFTIGFIWCLFSPKNPQNLSICGGMFSILSSLFGIKIKLRKSKSVENYLGNAIYIANHQNNYDLVILSKIIPNNTVTIGKKNLFWIPFFGLFYWITGNIFIDRNKKMKAYSTIMKLVNQLKEKRISFWIFPEGTRNNGRGLLPFKSGAFQAAIMAKVPIIPVVFSNTNNINLNRLKNGLVIIEMLAPIEFKTYKYLSVRELSRLCHNLILKKFEILNAEIETRKEYNDI